MAEFTYVTAIVIGIMFLSAGMNKWRSGVFRRQLAAYKLLPSPALTTMAHLIPAGEVLIAVGLLGGLIPRASLSAAAGMLVTFAVAMTVNLMRRRRIECGCGSKAKAISWTLVLRNLALAAVSSLAATERGAVGVRGLVQPSYVLTRSDATALILTVLAVALVMRELSSLIDLRRRLRSLTLPVIVKQVAS